jgi:5'-nucleotidase
MKKVILIDLDMTITDFHSTFMSIWKEKYPERKIIAIQDRKHFKLTDEYPEEFKEDIKAIINQPSFFANMLPMENAINGVHSLLGLNYEVIICTSPIQTIGCHSAKWDWVVKNLGVVLAKSMVIAKDKTLIRGDYLLDDRVIVSGLFTPSWKHILYSQGYNSNTREKRFSWEMDINELVKLMV